MSIFSKIITGEIPSYTVAETDQFLAFLDINPNAPGHTLCIPKREVDQLLDLDRDTYSGLMLFSRKVGLALQEVIDCKRIGVSVIGLEVPHVHVHVIPIKHMQDMQFTNKVQLEPAQMKRIASEASRAFIRLKD